MKRLILSCLRVLVYDRRTDERTDEQTFVIIESLSRLKNHWILLEFHGFGRKNYVFYQLPTNVPNKHTCKFLLLSFVIKDRTLLYIQCL